LSFSSNFRTSSVLNFSDVNSSSGSENNIIYYSFNNELSNEVSDLLKNVEYIKNTIITNEIEFTSNFTIDLLSISKDSEIRFNLNSILSISDDSYDTLNLILLVSEDLSDNISDMVYTVYNKNDIIALV